MHPADLAPLVDRELKQLPVPRAPHTLLPHILAAVQQWTLRPWYTRTWLTWPAGWQLASIASLMLLVAGGALLVPAAQAVADGAASTLASGTISDIADVLRRAELTMNAARIVRHALLAPLVAYAFALVFVMCLACAAFGTALTHVTFGRTLPS